jgi:hypothetical protein
MNGSTDRLFISMSMHKVENWSKWAASIVGYLDVIYLNKCTHGIKQQPQTHMNGLILAFVYNVTEICV